MNFVLVKPTELRAVWADVRAGLDKMPAEDWIAEDVYHAIRGGTAALYLGVGESGCQGFMVLRQQFAEFSGAPILHVWLAYSVAGADVYAQAEDYVRGIARQMGANRITFGSPRPGWAKRYPVVSTTYEIPKENP